MLLLEIIGLITIIYSTSIKVPISCLGILHICILWILRKIAPVSPILKRLKRTF